MNFRTYLLMCDHAVPQTALCFKGKAVQSGLQIIIFLSLSLTRSLLVYECIILWNHALSCYIPATLQLHNSPVNCARELFKPSKESVSILLWNENKIYVLGFGFFYEWFYQCGSFWPFWLRLSRPEPQPQEGSISLNFYWKLG